MLRTLLPFLGACTLIAASPGPSTMLIVRQSLRSRRAGFLTVLGNETGVFVWGTVAALGLTALLAASVFEVGYYGLYVWFVGRLQHVISRAAVRRRLEQVSGGVLLLLGVRMAVES